MTEAQRGTCWSITINNPTEQEILDGNLLVPLPAGWTCQGQLEKGAEGTIHYQAMLKTPQVRFSAVKKVFPRGHIELAKNAKALEKYVSKSETRVAEVNIARSNIPTLFEYQHTIAARWDVDEWNLFVNQKRTALGETAFDKLSEGDTALDYIDYLVGKDIEAGVCGVEYIAINPMWRSAWKKFYRQLVAREEKLKSTVEIYNAVEEQETQSVEQETQDDGTSQATYPVSE